jgi:hypothetical protein
MIFKNLGIAYKKNIVSLLQNPLSLNYDLKSIVIF